MGGSIRCGFRRAFLGLRAVNWRFLKGLCSILKMIETQALTSEVLDYATNPVSVYSRNPSWDSGGHFLLLKESRAPCKY